jgi:GT2 family glycosyltransferase
LGQKPDDFFGLAGRYLLNQDSKPLVSVIIPHYLGDIISECLTFVYERTVGVSLEVIVADDQPYDDGSLARAVEKFPNIIIVKTGGGNGQPTKGMGAGCNRGLEAAQGKYAMLLNSDVEVSDNWIQPLIDVLEADAEVGACQPKVRSLRERQRFDYGGAAGGLMDVLGFTFCQGRLFETVESDSGQYDLARDIFWGVGSALFLRMACLGQTGLMDEGFVMHMEEIDLCWRFHLTGYRIRYTPDSIVYHYGGFTLDADSYKKASYNHRNQLVMVLKNLSFLRLCCVLPVRVVLELANILLIFKGNWKHPLAALSGLFWVATHPLNIWRRRRDTQKRRRISDRDIVERFYPKSIVWQYFLRGIRSVQDLPRFDEGKVR